MSDERKRVAEETQPKKEKQRPKDDPPEKREKSQSPKETKRAKDSATGKASPRPRKETIPPTSSTSASIPPAERQVIAVSASKNPAAFFNLARRFLVTDEFCDLSALEGAIVSAVDAAHLLERSKLANIVRIQTSYVTVEPRKKSSSQHQHPPIPPNVTSVGAPVGVAAGSAGHHHAQQTQHALSASLSPKQYETSEDKKPHHGKRGNPLRRSRIIITVKRTEDYKQWLEDNDVDDDPAPAAIP